MGKRVNYEFAGMGGEASVILYANSSHGDVDTDAVFVNTTKEAGTVSSAVMELLGTTYPSDGGNNMAGDAVFTVDLEPADREYVVRAIYDKVWEGKAENFTFMKSENGKDWKPFELEQADSPKP